MRDNMDDGVKSPDLLVRVSHYVNSIEHSTKQGTHIEYPETSGVVRNMPCKYRLQ